MDFLDRFMILEQDDEVKVRQECEFWSIDYDMLQLNNLFKSVPLEQTGVQAKWLQLGPF